MEKIIQTPFIVIENLNEKGILGNNFLETNEASIDFYKRNLIVNIDSTMHKIVNG